MSSPPAPVTTTTVFASTTVGNDQNRYKIFDGSMSVSTASVIVAILHIVTLFVIFICQFIALQNGHIGGFLTFFTFVSFVLLIWSIISLIGLCAAFANNQSKWLYPLLYLVMFCIFYFTVMAGLTIAAMAVEGPSMEFMRAMYSNTAFYSDAVIKKYSSFKVFLREVTSPKLVIFLFVHIFAMVFDCAAFGVVLLCVEYLETKKPSNNQSQPENVELAQQPLMNSNADANVQRTSQYTVLAPTFKPAIGICG